MLQPKNSREGPKKEKKRQMGPNQNKKIGLYFMLVRDVSERQFVSTASGMLDALCAPGETGG